MAKKEKSEAAEKIVKAEKTKAKKPKADKPNIFVRMGKSIAKFWKDFRGELKKIVWPEFKTVIKSTGVVIASIGIFLIFVYLIDLGLSKSIDLLSDVARNANEEISEVADDTTTTTAALDNMIESTTAAPEDTTASATEASSAAQTTTAASTTAVTTTKAAG